MVADGLSRISSSAAVVDDTTEHTLLSSQSLNGIISLNDESFLIDVVRKA